MARYRPFRVARCRRATGRKKWYVSVPASASATGRPRRLFFETQEKALAFARARRLEIAEQGRGAPGVDPALASEALRAEKLLAPFGVSLLEAAAAQARRLGEARASRPVAEVSAELLAEKRERRSASYASGFAKTHRKLAAAFGPARLICEVGAGELEEILAAEAGSPHMFNALRAHASVVWSRAVKRGWAAENIVARLDKRETAPAPIVTLAPAELGRLLAAAEAAAPDAVGAFALSAFAGVRSEELRRLPWEAVNLAEGTVAVAEGVAKTKRFRLIEIRPALRAWLEAYPPPSGARRGPVCPANWPRKKSHVLARAGWGVLDKLVYETDREAARPAPGAPPWPRNVLRKSFGSAHLRAFDNLDATIQEMGHHGNPATFFRHYYQGMSKAAAAAWWRVGPAGTTLALEAVA